jgi:hypothetical protein
MIKWFAANKYVINLDKTNKTKFITKNSSHYTLHIDYKAKHTKCHGLQIDNHINCKNHTDQIEHVSDTLKWIYFAYFHCYKILIFSWGGGGVYSSNSGKIFTSQKKIVRIMAGAKPRTSCTSLFKELEILLIPCQYTLPLINFIPLNNQEMFHTTSSIYNINTRNKLHLRRPNANLTKKKLCCHKNFQQFTT